MLSAIAVFAISTGILLAAQSGCIGATLAGTDGSYNTPDTGLSEHAPVQEVTAGERMPDLIVACQIADTFADMLFTGMLDVAYAVHAVLSLTAVDNITGDSLVLGGASDITTFESGGHTYAVVASYSDYGVQILNITNPANITAAGSISYSLDLELRAARGITTFTSGGHTYAAVAAEFSDGVQILNITDPLRIAPASSITDDSTNTDDLELNGARGITTFVSGGHTYVAVAAYRDDGVQILNVTDPPNITPAGRITDDGTNTDDLELNGAQGITTFESGGHTYVAVAAYDDDGVQILNVTDLPNITPAGRITDDGTNTDDLELNGAYGITTFESGGHTYAAVAADNDNGVQILNITDPLRITPAGRIDINTLELRGAQDITTFESGGHTYVAVAVYDDNGVQILDVTDPPNITPAGNIIETDTNTDDLVLDGARGITTFESGGHTYAAVAAYFDSGVQIIRIDITESDTTPPSMSGAVATSLNSVTVRFSENVDADATDGSHWSLNGTDADSLTVFANTDPAISDSMTLTLSGDLPDTGPDDLELIYAKPDTGGITDGTNQLEDATVTVEDGIAPTVLSVEAVTSRSIAVRMSEPVTSGTAGPGGFSLTTGGTAPAVSSISVLGETVTLALSGPLPAGAVTLNYDSTSGNVADVSNNSLADFLLMTVDTPADITPPSIDRAVATSLNSVTVRFSENVDADAIDGSYWSLNGTDADSLTVFANTDPAISDSMTLTLSGDLPDTGPDDLELIYAKPTTGGITDGNNQLEDATVTVEDGIAPTVLSVEAVTSRSIAVRMSEPVTSDTAGPGGFSLTTGGTAPAVSSISVLGETVTLALSGPLPAGAVTLNYDSTSGNVADVSNNSLADFLLMTVDTPADITPPSIDRAVATSLNSVTVRFSENVDADAIDGSYWSLNGTDADSLTVFANTDPAISDSMTLTLSGDLPDTGPDDLELIYARPTTGGITDGNNQLEDATVTVEDGIAPTVLSVEAVTSRSIAVRMSEPVTSDTAGPGGFSLTTGGTAPAVSSISVLGETVTLALSGPLPAGAVTLNYDSTSGNVADVSNNSLADFLLMTVDTPADITPPSIDRAVATSLNSVTVRFSENVDADAIDGSYWSLNGTDADSLTVFANTDPAISDSMTLTLSGDLPDTGPDDLELIYAKPTTGGITDGNNQLEDATVTVEDGIAPTVLSVEAVTSRSIAVRMSEPVTSDTAGPGGFSLTTGGTAPAVSSISVLGETVTLALSGPLPAGAVTLNYDSTSGNVADVSNNSLADFLLMTVDTPADITPPSIDRAVATSLNSVTVRFSENVDADAIDGSYWSLNGTDADSLTVFANTDPAISDSMTLTLSGDLPDTGPDDLELIYAKPTTGGITDGNNQLEDATVTVEDGIAPTVLSVEAVTSRSIAVRMSEPVTSGTAGPGGFSLTTGGTAPAVSSISVSGETVTLALSGPLPAGAVTLNYDSTSGNVADVSNNSLADFLLMTVDTPADITPPSIDRAVATSLNSVTVRFSENVDADAIDGSYWSLNGTDADSLTVFANTDPAISDSMTLTLSGDLPDTGPDDLELIYARPTTGGITDGTNQLEGATVTVEDGIAPTVLSVEAVTSRSIAVRMSEPVTSDTAGPGGFSLTTGGTAPAVSSISVSGETVTLALSGPLPAGAVTLNYDSTSGNVADVSNNSLADFLLMTVDTPADITPPSIDRAVATSLNSVTVRFSENVDADAIDGSYWSLNGTDADSLTVFANTDPAISDSMTLTLSGDLPDTGPDDLELIYAKPTTGGITDGNNQLEDATVTVEDGIAPTVLSVEAVTSRSIAVRMSEPVTSGTAGPGGFSLTTGGTAPAVSSISVSGETVTLALSGPLPAGAVTLNYDSTSGNVADVSNNSLADFLLMTVDTPADITPPSIDRAVATSLNSVTVRFSENVDADAIDGSYWSLNGTDADSLTVFANTDPAISDSMTLTLSGDLPDTGPDDLELIYTKPDTGGITDGTNQLEGATVIVVDGIAPTVLSVEAVTSRSIAVRMSEPVTSDTAGPGGFSLTTGGTAPAVSSISVSGETVTLALSGPLPAGAVTLNYDSTSGNVADVSNNSLADFLLMTVDTTDDMTPPSIDRAVATSLNSVTVRFSENVDADAIDGSYWSLNGTDADSLTVFANTDPAISDSMTLTLSGDLPDTGPDDLELIYTKPDTGGITDGTNQLEGATVIVVDGIAPTVLSVEAVTSRSIAVRMSEPVTSDTAGPGGFSLTTGGTAPAVSSISVSGETVTLALSGPLPAGAVTLNYDSTSGNVADVSNNSLADFLLMTVDTPADITPPSIDRAVATSLNSVTVRFSENVDADAIDGSYWSLNGTDADSLTVFANTDPAISDSMTLTLSGDLPDTGPDDLELIYTKPDTGGITDGTNQLEGATVTVEDGIAPTVLSVEAVTSRSIAVRMSEPVTSDTAGPGGFSLTTGGTAPAVSSISVSGETVTLALSGPLPAGAVTLNYDSTSGNVADVSNNSLADFLLMTVDTPADITPPSIDRAVATSLNSVTVRFSENVDADAIDGSYWSLNGTDADSLTVFANTDPAISDSMTLTLSGDLPDTGPDDLELIYAKPDTGGITDGNNQLEDATVTVEDGIAPTVLSVEAVTSRSIAVRMSEPVTSDTAGPGGFSLTTGGTAPAVSSISVSGETVTLALSGPLPAGAVTLNYDSTSGNVADVSNNSLADFLLMTVDTPADITPPSIDRAVATSLNSVTVRFSENVDADAIDGSYWSLNGTDADSLTVFANTDPAISDSMTLTLSGDLPDTGPDDLELIYAKPTTGGITDGNNQLEDATVTVEDGIAPTVLSVEAVTSRSIAVRMSEPVTSGTAGPGGFSLTTGGTAPAVSSISVSGETVTLALSGPLPAGTISLSYDSTSGNVADVPNNTLADFSSVAVDTTDDMTPPVIIIHGSNPARVLVGTVYSDAGATCRDNFDGDFAPTSMISTVNASKAGSYTVTYTCIDVENNESEKTRTVRVLEEGDFTRSKSSKSTPLTVDSDIMIDGKSHDIGGSGTVTIKQNEVMTGEPVDITFTAHSADDIIHLTVYLNLHGDDTGYAYSDTYIRYDHGTVQIHDPHNFISDASITITDDTEQPDKKIIDIIIEFDGDMGLTNMVLYMWNEDRRSQLIRILDAFEVAAPLEPVMQAADPEPLEPDSGLPADPEPVAPDFAGDAADPEPVPADTLWPDDYDEAQALNLIRMWSGFEPEMITDEQMLASLGLDYPDADIPDWMMTQLGVLVAKGDVTTDEFLLALQYVLTHA